MGKGILRKTILALLLIFIPILGVSPLFAQEDTPQLETENEIFEYVNKELGFTISPSIKEHLLEREDHIRGEIKISKKIDEPIPVGISISKYIPGGGDERIFNEELSDASSWVQIEKPAVILQGEEKKVIEYTIKVPDDADPGTYFTSILFQPVLPPSFFNIQSVHIMPYIGGLLVINVQGEEGDNSTPTITEFRYRTSQQKELENFNATIHNESDFYKEVQGKIFVQDFQNRIIEVIDIEPIRLLPKEDRIINLKPTKELELGVYSAKMEISETTDSDEKTAEEISFLAFESTLEILILITIIIGVFTVVFVSIKYLVSMVKNGKHPK